MNLKINMIIVTLILSICLLLNPANLQNTWMRTYNGSYVVRATDNLLILYSTTSQNNTVVLWNPNNGQLLYETTFRITRMWDFIIQGDYIFTGSSGCSSLPQAQMIERRRISNPSDTVILPNLLPDSFHVFNDSIYTYTLNQNIKQYDLNGNFRKTFTMSYSNDNAISYAANDKNLYVLIEKARVLLQYNIQSGLLEKTVAAFPEGGGAYLKLSGNKLFGLHYTNSRVYEWNIPDLTLTRSYTIDNLASCPASILSKNMFDVHGGFLYVIVSNTVKKYDTSRNGALVFTFTARKTLTSVSASERFVFAASASENSTFQWNNTACRDNQLFIDNMCQEPFSSPGLIRTYFALHIKYLDDDGILYLNYGSYSSRIVYMFNSTSGDYIVSTRFSNSGVWDLRRKDGFLFAGGRGCNVGTGFIEKVPLLGSTSQVIIPSTVINTVVWDLVGDSIYAHDRFHEVKRFTLNGLLINEYPITGVVNADWAQSFHEYNDILYVSYSSTNVIVKYNITSTAIIDTLPSNHTGTAFWMKLSENRLFTHSYTNGVIFEIIIPSDKTVRSYSVNSVSWCPSAGIGRNVYYAERNYLYLVFGMTVRKYDVKQNGILVNVFYGRNTLYSVFASEKFVFAGNPSDEIIYQWNNDNCPNGYQYDTLTLSCINLKTNLKMIYSALHIKFLGKNGIIYLNYGSYSSKTVYLYNTTDGTIITSLIFSNSKIWDLREKNGYVYAGGNGCYVGAAQIERMLIGNSSSEIVVPSSVTVWDIADDFIYSHTQNQNIKRYTLNGILETEYVLSASVSTDWVQSYCVKNGYLYAVSSPLNVISKFNNTSGNLIDTIFTNHVGTLMMKCSNDRLFIHSFTSGRIFEWLLPYVTFVRSYLVNPTTFCPSTRIGRNLFDVERNFLYIADGNMVRKYDINLNGTVVKNFTASGTVFSVFASEPYVFGGVPNEEFIYQWYNFDCPEGYGLNAQDNGCVSCSDGSYKQGDYHDFCVKCPADQEANTNKSGCVSCPSAKYRKLGSSDGCLNCTQNSYCNSTHILCDPGYELTESNTCASCRPGFYKFTGNKCLPCPQNHYKDKSGPGSCQICPIGTESAYNSTGCLTCSVGKFKPTNLGFLNCVDCPEGASCTSSELTCLPGYSPSKNQSYACDKCRDGFYKGISGNSSCLECPTGLFSSDDYTECLPCKAGEILIANTGLCERCVIGFQPNSNRTICVDCPPNTFKSSVSWNLCRRCPTGGTCSKTSFLCNSGYTSKGTESNCYLCDNGFFKDAAGNGDCVKCSAGYQSVSDRSKCEECPTGTYKPQNGIHLFCTPCPLGADCTPTEFKCRNGWKLISDATGCEENVAVNGNSTADKTISKENKSGSSEDSKTIATSTIFYISIIPGFIVITLIGYGLRRHQKSKQATGNTLEMLDTNGSMTNITDVTSVTQTLDYAQDMVA